MTANRKLTTDLNSEELIRQEFSDEYREDIIQRSEQLKSGEVKGIPLEEIQEEMATRIQA